MDDPTYIRALFDLNSDAVFAFDEKGVLIKANEVAQGWLGGTEVDWQGLTFAHLFVPELALQAQAQFARAWAGESLSADMAFLCQVDQRVDVRVKYVPIRGNDRTVGVYLVAEDITQRQLMLDELRTTKNQLESFIENTVDAIVIFDVHGTLLRVNPAYEQMFGYTQEELVGVHVSDQKIIPPHLKEDVLRKAERALQGESILGTESICLTKSGDVLDVLLSITPIRLNCAEVAGWSVTFRDITERKRTQELLLQSEKLSIAGQLAAGVAHEIRNPLTALKGFVQLMMMSGKENELYLDVMSSELNRIELIVSELLVLAKPQVTTFHTKDVTRLLQEVVTLIDTQAIMSNIQVVTDFVADLPWMLCDDNQLKQVFINFLKNAIEAMQSGGTIRIEAHSGEHQQVLLRFIDQGCGISADRIARIGEPFYTTKEKGTGLGMMVSKKIIENHGGQMKIHSQLGVGTTIELVLPGVGKPEGS